MPEGMPLTACVRKSNRITSVTAIVAPHTCDLVRGAFVLAHGRVPLYSPLSLPVFPLATFAPIVLRLVFLRCFKIGFGPKADCHSSQRLRRRHGDFPLVHPAIKGFSSNAKDLGDSERGICLHLKNRIPHSICQVEILCDGDSRAVGILPREAARPGRNSFAPAVNG
jgi:hypothetical protein